MIGKALALFCMAGLLFACNEKDPCIDESKIDENAICVQIFDPVCGCNDVTYANSCVAEAAGVTRWSKGECPDGE